VPSYTAEAGPIGPVAASARPPTTELLRTQQINEAAPGERDGLG
jgi:hypothetical protein